MIVESEDTPQTGYSDECDDEDVTLEGTPLHEYLNDLSLVDKDSFYYNDRQIQKENRLSMAPLQARILQDYLHTQWRWLWTSFATYFPLCNDVLSEMKEHFYSKCSVEILESKIMLEDDLDYLCLQTPQQFLHIEKHKQYGSVIPQLNLQKAKRHKILVSSYILLFVAFLFSSFLPYVIYICIGLFTVFITCYNLRLQIITEMLKRSHEGNLQALQKFLKSSEKLQSLISRSIKLIQEMEVVSRGYKLINGRTPITRLEKSYMETARAFPKLRITVFKCEVKCILACRHATVRLLQYPLQEDVEVMEPYYICKIPLTELGTCFTEETTCDELFDVTDGYSLILLKSLNELLRRQRSEMLTRFSLVLSGSNLDLESSDFMSNFASLFARPQKETTVWISTLQSCFDVHKHVSAMKEEETNPVNKAELSNSTSLLKINLHSLQVHMRAALHKSMELEDQLTKEIEISESNSFADLRKHLDSAIECWEQCDKEVALLHRDQVNGVTDNFAPVSKIEEASNEEEDCEVATTLSDADDEDMEDKVYEATTEDRSDDQPCRRSNDFEATEKKVREESATVIRELQSVLAFMTSEKEREKWKQQLFPAYKPKIIEEKRADEGSEFKPPAEAIPEEAVESNTFPDKNIIKPSHLSPVVDVEADNVSVTPSDHNEIPHGSGSSKSEEEISSRHQFPSSALEITSKVIDQTFGKELLSVPRKPLPPGRPPSLRKRRVPSSLSSVNNHNARDGFLSPPQVLQSVAETTDDDRANDKIDWALGLGIGFSNALALQAVKIAKMRKSVLPGFTHSVESVTYGSDSTDDEEGDGSIAK